MALNLFNCDVEQRCVSRDRDMHSVRSTVLRLTFVVVNRRRNAQRTSSIVLAKSIAGAIELCIVNQLSCERIYVTHKAFISETSQTIQRQRRSITTARRSASQCNEIVRAFDLISLP